MAQHLGIVAALLGDPWVLIFDEPVNGLDTEGVLWIRTLLKSLAGVGRRCSCPAISRARWPSRPTGRSPSAVDALIAETTAADSSMTVRATSCACGHPRPVRSHRSTSHKSRLVRSPFS